MREGIAAIVKHDCAEQAQLPNLLAALPNTGALWEPMSA